MAFLEGGLGETILWPPKNGFPQKTLFSKGNAPSFSGYRRRPARAERACPRMLRGHVPARPAAAFHLARLSLGVLTRYSSLPRIYGSILMNKTRFVKRYIHRSRGKRKLKYMFPLSPFSEGGLGGTDLRLPLAGEGGAKRRMRLSKERFPPAMYSSVFRIKRSWSWTAPCTAAGPGCRRRSLRPRRRSASDTRRNRARRRPFAARWAR